VSAVDVDEIYAQLATINTRAHAERLRLQATQLALDYHRLVARLEAEVVDSDVAAVIRAWRGVASREQ
jgi:hypothetical protein